MARHTAAAAAPPGAGPKTDRMFPQSSPFPFKIKLPLLSCDMAPAPGGRGLRKEMGEKTTCPAQAQLELRMGATRCSSILPEQTSEGKGSFAQSFRRLFYAAFLVDLVLAMQNLLLQLF